MCPLSSPVLLSYNPAHLFSDLSCFHSRLEPEPYPDQSPTSAQALALNPSGSRQAPAPLAEGWLAGLGAYFPFRSPSLALRCPSGFRSQLLTAFHLHSDTWRATLFVLFPLVSSSPVFSSLGSEL